MPRLRSQTGFTGILPPELVERCVEFLPFEEVHTNIKQISKELLSAARRSLTRGRWRPIKYVLENAIVALGLPSPASETAQFQAAWALDAGLVLLELVVLWNNTKEKLKGEPLFGDETSIFWDWDRLQFKPSMARFLAIVEPSIDGLGRFTMALERVEHYIIARGEGRYLSEKPLTLLGLWTERLGESALVKRSGSRWRISLDELLNPESLVGSGLESWAEPGDMVSFIDWLRDWTDADVHLMNEAAEAWSSHWQDRRKADILVTAVESKVQEWFVDYGPDY